MIGIIRRLIWAVLVLPSIAVWFVSMLLHWIITGKEPPAMGLSQWMYKGRDAVLGRGEE